jgi:hypothetical protein
MRSSTIFEVAGFPERCTSTTMVRQPVGMRGTFGVSPETTAPHGPSQQ